MSSVPVITAAVRPDAAKSAAAAIGESTPSAPRALMPPAASRFCAQAVRGEWAATGPSAAWAQNLLAAGGIEARGADGVDSPIAAAADFAASGGARPGVLLLDTAFAVPEAGSFVALRRHHTQSLTAMSVSAVRGAEGNVAIAATGAAPDACRLLSAEAVLAGGGSIAEAADASVADADPYDDVLASAAYRRRVLPVYVGRALEQLGE